MKEQDVAICRKCSDNPCEYYGEVGGYSVQCVSCNKKKAEKQRISRHKRKSRDQEYK